MSTVVVERNTAANLEQRFYVDGVLTNASAGVTVTVTRADGSVLVTAATTINPSPGVYRYALAPQANLDRLTVDWTGTWSAQLQTQTTQVEIVGDFYVSVAELRTLPNLSDTAKFTNAELIEARQWFESTFENYTGVAWVPRYRRVTLNGTGWSTILLPDLHPRVIRSIRTYTAHDTYTSYTPAELAAVAVEPSGRLRNWTGYFPAGANNIVVAYEHGHDAAPSDVREAAKVAIRDKLLGDNTGNRQFSVQTEAGIVRNSTPGEGRPFGIPFVDSVANRRAGAGAGTVAIA